MTKSNDKIEYLIKYISNHPKESGNRIYTKFKGSKYGMRKKDFYKVYRNTKGLKKPSKEVREKSIPKKYRAKVKRERKLEKKVEREKIPKGVNYDPFYSTLETMVFEKMRRKPDNFRDLEHKMFTYGFHWVKNEKLNRMEKAWPTHKQVKIAWNHLRSKGLTERCQDCLESFKK
jgi:hypothetical protein